MSSSKGTGLQPVHVLEVVGNAIVGGMENYVHNLVQMLPSYGFKVTCLAPYESSYTAQLRRLGCEVFVTDMHVDVPFRSLQFTSELVRQQHIDLLHAHLPRAHALAGLVGQITGRPVAATFHGMEFNIEELGISQMTSSHIIAVCQKAYMQGLGLGITPERISLIPNGVNSKVFTPSRNGLEWRQKHNIPLDVPLVGFAGRLAFEKGPDLFIHLADHLHKQLPQVHFVLVGEGPMEADVRRLIMEYDLGEFIHLAGLSHQMNEVYPALDVQIMTSRYEGMPFALLEGMSCGVPSAAFAVGGVSEIIEVGTTGITSAMQDWAGLANGLATLLRDSSQLKKMGGAARKRVEQNFDLSDSVLRTSNLFRELVKVDTAERSVEPGWVLTRQETVPLPVKSTLGKNS